MNTTTEGGFFQRLFRNTEQFTGTGDASVFNDDVAAWHLVAINQVGLIIFRNRYDAAQKVTVIRSQSLVAERFAAGCDNLFLPLQVFYRRAAGLLCHCN